MVNCWKCFSRPSPDDVYDIDDYRPLIRSKHPITIKAQERRNPSSNLAVRYERKYGTSLKFNSDRSPHRSPVSMSVRPTRHQIWRSEQKYQVCCYSNFVKKNTLDLTHNCLESYKTKRQYYSNCLSDIRLKKLTVSSFIMESA